MPTKGNLDPRAAAIKAGVASESRPVQRGFARFIRAVAGSVDRDARRVAKATRHAAAREINKS
jgi:hypothetical protein